MPFWAGIEVSKVDEDKVDDYFAWRRRHRTQYGEPPTNGTPRDRADQQRDVRRERRSDLDLVAIRA